MCILIVTMRPSEINPRRIPPQSNPPSSTRGRIVMSPEDLVGMYNKYNNPQDAAKKLQGAKYHTTSERGTIVMSPEDLVRMFDEHNKPPREEKKLPIGTGNAGRDITLGVHKRHDGTGQTKRKRSPQQSDQRKFPRNSYSQDSVHRDPIRKLSRAKNEVGRVAIESFNKKFNQKVQFNKIQNKELKSKLKLMSLNKNAKKIKLAILNKIKNPQIKHEVEQTLNNRIKQIEVELNKEILKEEGVTPGMIEML